MDEVEKRRRRILAFIREFMDERGYPPTLREIGDGMDISSTSVVFHHLEALETRGLIERDRERARGIRLKGG